MNKKNKLAFIVLIVMSFFIVSCSIGQGNNMNNDTRESDTVNNNNANGNDKEKETLLPIPPLVEGDIELIAQTGEVEFFEGIKTNTRGYNGNILGPTIRFQSKEVSTVKIINQMEEDTTVHWHGLLVDSDVDGVFNIVEQGKEVIQKMNITQSAATAWYHPHTMGKTASQVMEGLAGFIIIEDENSQSLELPRDYGVNDIPVVFQLKGFDKNGQISLDQRRDYSLVNGVNLPTLKVKNEWIRLRMLNGNNDEVIDFDIDNKINKYIIATDDGFINKPKKIDELLLAPGERVELLLDLTEVNLDSYINVYANEELAFKIQIDSLVNEEYVYNLPQILIEEERVDFNINDLQKREFELSMNHMRPLINGESYDEDYINVKVKLDSKEIWTIRNANRTMMDMPHPFHVHGVRFKVLSRDGDPPFVWEEGYKDTVLLYPGESIELLVEFNNKGTFVYHCHFLEHEEEGMMGNFIVE